MKNIFMINTINSHIINCEQFLKSMVVMANKNDGVIDKDEKKIIDKAEKLTKKYEEQLRKLIKQ